MRGLDRPLAHEVQSTDIPRRPCCPETSLKGVRFIAYLRLFLRRSAVCLNRVHAERPSKQAITFDENDNPRLWESQVAIPPYS